MPCGVTRIIRTRARSIHTSFTCGKSWNRILRSRVSFLPFTALVINSSADTKLHMAQAAFTPALAPRRPDLAVSPRHRTVVRESREHLEAKLAALQKDYAELHTAIFEAA